MIAIAKFSGGENLVAMYNLLEHTEPEIDVNVIVHYHVGGLPIQDVYIGVLWTSVCDYIKPLFDHVDGNVIDVVMVYGSMINFAHQDYGDPTL